MFDIISLTFYAFGAVLFAIAVLIAVLTRKSSRKSSGNVKPPPENPKSKLETFKVETVYLHKLTLTNIDSAFGLLKTLSKKGIAAALIPKGEEMVVQFTHDKPLKNAKELKAKGLIKNYEIMEVFGY